MLAGSYRLRTAYYAAVLLPRWDYGIWGTSPVSAEACMVPFKREVGRCVRVIKSARYGCSHQHRA